MLILCVAAGPFLLQVGGMGDLDAPRDKENVPGKRPGLLTVWPCQPIMKTERALQQAVSPSKSV